MSDLPPSAVIADIAGRLKSACCRTSAPRDSRNGLYRPASGWFIPACGDIDSCAHVPCQSKTPISHWTAGCFCDGCLGGGAGSMSSGSPSFSIISAISASQARAIAAQLFARTKLGEDGAENFRHLAKRRRHCGRGVGPSFGFPRARKTVVFTRLSDCYSFHMDKRNLIGLFVIGIFADPLAVSAAISQNSNGWTDITPSSYTKIIYVSSSTGNDSTCAPASPPVNPAGVTPCKTIRRGKSFMCDGYPDWLLLKKGDTWTNEAIGDI